MSDRMGTGRVVVVGGGLAGITAALRCADAGQSVTLYEARPRLGGLTHSFRRGDLIVDNGQHVFLRCCTSYLALLERLGVADQVSLQRRLHVPVLAPDAPPASLRRGRLPAPLHLGASLLRYRPMTPGERVRAARAALALRAVDPLDPATDTQTFGAWLTAHGQSPRAVAALWDLVGVATLNARASQASLAAAATVFQQALLTDASAGDIGWSRVPLQALHGDAATDCLAAAGAQVRTGTKVEALTQVDGGWSVGVDRQEHRAERVVLAVPPPAAERLLPPGALASAPGWSARLGSAPIVNVHVHYDRHVLDGDFAAGLGTPVQWVFDRTAQSGLRRGQYVAVSISAADDVIDVPAAELRATMLPALADLLPAARGAQVLDVFVTRERNATFRPLPGTQVLRPTATTAAPGLFLAGAWTATGWPATMEGAVRSGEAAAAAVVGRPVPGAPAEAVAA